MISPTLRKLELAQCQHLSIAEAVAVLKPLTSLTDLIIIDTIKQSSEIIIREDILQTASARFPQLQRLLLKGRYGNDMINLLRHLVYPPSTTVELYWVTHGFRSGFFEGAEIDTSFSKVIARCVTDAISPVSLSLHTDMPKSIVLMLWTTRQSLIQLASQEWATCEECVVNLIIFCCLQLVYIHVR